MKLQSPDDFPQAQACQDRAENRRIKASSIITIIIIISRILTIIMFDLYFYFDYYRFYYSYYYLYFCYSYYNYGSGLRAKSMEGRCSSQA